MRVVERANRLLDSPTLAAQVARTPVQGPKAIEDRPANAKLGVAAELHLLFGVKLLQRIHQSQNPRAHQIFDLDMLRQTFVNTTGEKPYRGQVIDHHPASCSRADPPTPRNFRVGLFFVPCSCGRINRTLFGGQTFSLRDLDARHRQVRRHPPETELRLIGNVPHKPRVLRASSFPWPHVLHVSKVPSSLLSLFLATHH